MARSLWTGSLSFGLVNVPVAMYSGVRDVDLHFRQLHAKDGAPIEVQRWCPEDDAEIPYEDIAHAYELDSGQQVIVSDAELEAAAPQRTRTIDIEQFVDLAQVDPVYFDHPYLLAPASEDDGARRAYRLLADVMQSTDRAAIGRVVVRSKEYLAIIRSRGHALTLTTMYFADEVRSAKDVAAATQKQHKPTPKALDAAVAVIEQLAQEWDPERYTDGYRKRLQKVVARKRKGGTVTIPDTGDQTPPPATDLMQALEQTLAGLSAKG
jgi:DNA end-binding protein Ku